MTKKDQITSTLMIDGHCDIWNIVPESSYPLLLGKGVREYIQTLLGSWVYEMQGMIIKKVWVDLPWGATTIIKDNPNDKKKIKDLEEKLQEIKNTPIAKVHVSTGSAPATNTKGIPYKDLYEDKIKDYERLEKIFANNESKMLSLDEDKKYYQSKYDDMLSTYDPEILKWYQDTITKLNEINAKLSKEIQELSEARIVEYQPITKEEIDSAGPLDFTKPIPTLQSAFTW